MQEFRNIHTGGTALLVGNGANLHLTPPAWFDYPAFGMNTIHRYEGWTPTYYTTVDNRVYREFRKEIVSKFADLPKFIPTPNLDMWQGENFYRFTHKPGELKDGWNPDLSTGLTFKNIMHVAMQLAYWMGFTTLLLIGVEHKPEEHKSHFWGEDVNMPGTPPLSEWLDCYRVLVQGLKLRGVRVLNISEKTYVPETVLPRGDWREWRNT